MSYITDCPYCTGDRLQVTRLAASCNLPLTEDGFSFMDGSCDTEDEIVTCSDCGVEWELSALYKPEEDSVHAWPAVAYDGNAWLGAGGEEVSDVRLAALFYSDGERPPEECMLMDIPQAVGWVTYTLLFGIHITVSPDNDVSLVSDLASVFRDAGHSDARAGGAAGALELMLLYMAGSGLDLSDDGLLTPIHTTVMNFISRKEPDVTGS